MTYSTALGKEALFLQSVNNSVNYVQIAGAATGTNPVSAPGTDTDIGITLTPKGAGNTIISSGAVAIGSTTVTAGAALDLSNNTTTSNSSLILPVGTVSTRPGTGAVGMIRYSSSAPGIEAYVGRRGSRCCRARRGCWACRTAARAIRR